MIRSECMIKLSKPSSERIWSLLPFLLSGNNISLFSSFQKKKIGSTELVFKVKYVTHQIDVEHWNMDGLARMLNL